MVYSFILFLLYFQVAAVAQYQQVLTRSNILDIDDGILLADAQLLHYTTMHIVQVSLYRSYRCSS
ncbi:hypothetical protein D3C87_1735890 [compost metagenome]